MNKNSIKKFAIEARRDLIARVSQRAALFEITDQGYSDPSADSVLGTVMSAEQKKQRQALIARIREKGYEQVMEEIAYTWFNRFIALRFMEVNGYLPSRVRVFTDDQNAFKPQILVEAIDMELEGLDMQKVYAFKNANDNDGLFKYMIITQCNALSAVLPGMFQHISDYTELLFPDHLLWEDSVIDRMISMIPEEDWTDQVQIIGWLYQYYNTEPKDKVFENLKKNIKISKENIPAATQLFTPDWIVRYMVENSLGRIAINARMSEEYHLSLSESERQAEEKALAESYGFRYYLPEAPQNPEVRKQLPTAHCPLPTKLKCIDPCMGSGHILCYMFDVLVKLYEAYGYTSRDAVANIIENNLYGLDIDERAAQLAYFAVMMKARQYDRRFFSRGLKPHIHGFRESNGMNRDYLELFGSLKPTAMKLCENFTDALEYGSIIEIKLTPDELAALREKYDEIEGTELYNDFFDTARRSGLVTLFKPMLEIAEALSIKYDAVITNPPYMGSSGMGGKLSEYVKKNYPDSKSDLFAVCIERGNNMTKPHGCNCMVTMQSWMFLSSFEKMRLNCLDTRTIKNLMHMENMVMGIAFGTAVTAFWNERIKGYKGTYNQIKLADIENGEPKSFPVTGNRFAQVSTENFEKIPGAPVAYWLTSSVISLFSNAARIADVALPKQGSTLGDNAQFIRLWYEIGSRRTKWFNCMKGGEYRRWYGNLLYVLDWEDNGRRVKRSGRATIRSEELLFRKGITWSNITSGKSSFRYMPQGFFFESTGSVCFMREEIASYLLAFLNSPVCEMLNKAINPTVHLQSGDIAKLPIVFSDEYATIANQLTEDNITISKYDWDSFETSWDFKRHPLV